MNPSPEQRQVIETQDRAVVVEAGAGTGKTWAKAQGRLPRIHSSIHY